MIILVRNTAINMLTSKLPVMNYRTFRISVEKKKIITYLSN